ncbi:MAG: hydrolase [Mariprofundaceae bacterium]
MRLACGCPAEYPDWRGDVDPGGMLVHREKMPAFLHMPIGYEACLDRQMKDIARLELHERWPGFALTRTGMFGGEILAPLVEEHCPARQTFRLPNPWPVRVQMFEGDVGGIKDAVRRMQSELLDEGKMPKALYLAYLTCPRCAESRGGMRLMILRHWVKSERLARRLQRGG